MRVRVKADSERGFTLIELIITIVIIGILAGVAIPKFIDINKSAKAVACKENQAVIESACALYYADEALHQRTAQYPPALDNLVPGILDKLPVCPSGGNYTAFYVPASGTTSCSSGDPDHAR